MDTSIKIGPIGDGLIKTVFTRDMKFNGKLFIHPLLKVIMPIM